MMRGYDHGTNDCRRQAEDENEDEYDDQAEYEEEDFVVEDENDQVVLEEEEEEEPSGQQEILALREQFKAEIRRENNAKAAAAGTAVSSSSSQEIRPPVKGKFGNFFGPSRPSLAPRVIEEGSSLRKQAQKKDLPMASKTQSQTTDTGGYQQKPKFVSEEKRKVDTLRQNRDYSCLFSDDADIRTPTKEQTDNMSALPPKSDPGLIPSSGKSKVSTSQPARLSKDRGLKSPRSMQSLCQSKVGSLGNGSSLPVIKKSPTHEMPSKSSIANKLNDPSLKKNRVASKQNSSSQNQRLQSSPNGQKLQQSLQSKRSLALPQGQRNQQSTRSQRLQQSSQSQRPQSDGTQTQSLQSRRPNSSLQGRPSGQKGSVQSHDDRSKSARKQLDPSSKLEPSRPISSNGVYDDHAKKKRAVKRKFSEELDYGDNVRSIVREIFRYHPEKFADRDEDDSDMVADFATIQREERISSKIGRKEDEEEERLELERKRQKSKRKR